MVSSRRYFLELSAISKSLGAVKQVDEDPVWFTLGFTDTGRPSEGQADCGGSVLHARTKIEVTI